MRRNLEFLVALLAALLVLGQNDEVAAQVPAPEEEEGLPDLAGDRSHRDLGGAVDDADMEGVVVSGPAADPGGDEAELTSDEVHTVQTGDTLWDLSSHYLGSPWYWPKVWSFNPQIENPHWIYPGDRIRLGDGTRKTEEQQVAHSALDEFGSFDGEEVSVAGQIGYQPAGPLRVPTLGFMSDTELGMAGRIAKSWEEKDLLYEGDRIYVEVRHPALVRVGESAVIFRQERKVTHPLTGENLGNITRILGSATWVQAPTEGKLATAVISRSVMEISRGDLIGPSGVANFNEVQRIANDAKVRGVIADTLEDEIRELAAGHLVFLDKGVGDGVQVGNTLEVVRATDGLADTGFVPPHDDQLPAETIGRVLVVDAHDRSSVAVVLSSARELRRGDRVVMNLESGEG